MVPRITRGRRKSRDTNTRISSTTGKSSVGTFVERLSRLTWQQAKQLLGDGADSLLSASRGRFEPDPDADVYLGGGLFRVHGPSGTAVFTSGTQAIAAAEEQARSLALDAVRQLGAKDPEVTSSISKYHLPDAVDDNGLLEAVVRAEALGRPETH